MYLTWRRTEGPWGFLLSPSPILRTRRTGSLEQDEPEARGATGVLFKSREGTSFGLKRESTMHSARAVTKARRCAPERTPILHTPSAVSFLAYR